MPVLRYKFHGLNGSHYRRSHIYKTVTLDMINRAKILHHIAKYIEKYNPIAGEDGKIYLNIDEPRTYITVNGTFNYNLIPYEKALKTMELCTEQSYNQNHVYEYTNNYDKCANLAVKCKTFHYDVDNNIYSALEVFRRSSI